MTSRLELLRLSVVALIAAVLGPLETAQERRTRLIREALATPEGRRKLSEAMLQGARVSRLPAEEGERIGRRALAEYRRSQAAWDRSKRYVDSLGLWEYRPDLSRWARISIDHACDENARNGRG